MIVNAISFDILRQLAGHHLGAQDVSCPICSAYPNRSAAGRRRKVFRIWPVSPTFITYRCARCEAYGHSREDGAPTPDPTHLAKARAEAQQFTATAAETRRGKARWLWGQRRPIIGTPAEQYLREARCYGGPIPATIGFLPARSDHSPAMISAFGLPTEVEPGVISITTAAIQGVHLTRLKPDGSAKAGSDTDKLMIGTPRGAPIVVAAINNLLGVAISEGIEDALSIYEATGLGVWAAGSASFMPALADAVPDWMDCVTIVVDDDAPGRQNADELARRLDQRGHQVRLVVPARGRIIP